MKRILSVLLVLVIAISLVSCGTQKTPKTTSSSAQVDANLTSVTIETNINDKVTKFEFKTDLKTVEALMVEKQEELKATLEDSQYGKYVVGINDYKANAGNNEYFELIVNGKTAPKGIAETPIFEGDTYTFKLSKF